LGKNLRNDADTHQPPLEGYHPPAVGILQAKITDGCKGSGNHEKDGQPIHFSPE